MRARIASILFLSLLAILLTLTPAWAQQEPTVVRVVLFWMEGCPHCHDVLDHVLPPLQEQYGAQLEILLVEVVTLDDIDLLYEIAATYGISREYVGVPFLIIGDQALIGSLQIPEGLPKLIEHHLAQGGVDWPSIPNLNDYLAQNVPAAPADPTATDAVVRAYLFRMPDCPDCEWIAAQTLEPIMEKYGAQLDMQTIRVITPADVEFAHQVAADYGVKKEAVSFPLLIIGDIVLMGKEISTRMPDQVEELLKQGGTDLPLLPPRLEVTATPAPITPPTDDDPGVIVGSSGFALAIVIMLLMGISLIFSIIAFFGGKSYRLPTWAEWFIPALIAIGLVVAGYLSYVETQMVEAICGPVGDCNAVQSSPYARLFGVLPIGVLGLAGYLLMLAAWIVRRLIPRLERSAALALFGMAFFGTVFSLYLTYLEPFVIRAVCSWCLASAVIITLLLLFSLPLSSRQRMEGSE